jgi:hypothetical protein
MAGTAETGAQVSILIAVARLSAKIFEPTGPARGVTVHLLLSNGLGNRHHRRSSIWQALRS